MVSTNVFSQLADWLDGDRGTASAYGQPVAASRTSPNRDMTSSVRYATARRHSRGKASVPNQAARRRLRKPMGV